MRPAIVDYASYPSGPRGSTFAFTLSVGTFVTRAHVRLHGPCFEVRLTNDQPFRIDRELTTDFASTQLRLAGTDDPQVERESRTTVWLYGGQPMVFG